MSLRYGKDRETVFCFSYPSAFAFTKSRLFCMQECEWVCQILWTSSWICAYQETIFFQIWRGMVTSFSFVFCFFSAFPHVPFYQIRFWFGSLDNVITNFNLSDADWLFVLGNRLKIKHSTTFHIYSMFQTFTDTLYFLTTDTLFWTKLAPWKYSLSEEI